MVNLKSVFFLIIICLAGVCGVFAEDGGRGEDQLKKDEIAQMNQPKEYFLSGKKEVAFFESIPQDVLKQIRSDQPTGILMFASNKTSLIFGGIMMLPDMKSVTLSPTNGNVYLFWSEVPFQELNVEVFYPFGKKFPGIFGVKYKNNEFFVPFKNGGIRYIHIDNLGRLEVRDINIDSQKVMDVIRPHLNSPEIRSFETIISGIKQYFADPSPWVIPESGNKVGLKQLMKPIKSVHMSVDKERWIKTFPLGPEQEKARDFVYKRKQEYPGEYKDQAAVERHIRIMSPRRQAVTSPYHWAVMEQLRKEMPPEKHNVRAVPADVFVFNSGEPADRSVTKVGGLPYWPQDQEWPRSQAGRPLVFIGQLNFRDSADIVGPLPGDILLVFADESIVDNGYMPTEKSDLSFFWQTVDPDVRLVQTKDVPELKWSLSPCYGDIYRTKDYIDADDGSKNDVDEDSYDLFVWEGTKIGGVPYWIQGPECIGSRYLGSFGSINPKEDGAYPFINSASSQASSNDGGAPRSDLDEQETSLQGLIMWGDGGSLHLFIDDDGTICYSAECY